MWGSIGAVSVSVNVSCTLASGPATASQVMSTGIPAMSEPTFDGPYANYAGWERIEGGKVVTPVVTLTTPGVEEKVNQALWDGRYVNFIHLALYDRTRYDVTYDTQTGVGTMHSISRAKCAI